MLLNDLEYDEARRRFQDEASALTLLRTKLRRMCFREHEIEKAVRAREVAQRQLAAHIECYARLRSGDLSSVPERSAGEALVALRIALGVSQHELAEALGISDEQIARDERHRYAGLSVTTVQRMLELTRWL